jgi:hypothetical protein
MARTKQAAKVLDGGISRDEAYDLYTQIFDEFAIEVPKDKAEAERMQTVVSAINARLQDAGSEQTIVRDYVNSRINEIWQCYQTYDSWTREQAEEAFNHAWPTDLVIVVEPEINRTETGGTCYCGCGAQTARNRAYRPGHDARHAGQVARAILGTGRQDLLDTLPTQALRDKAQAQVDRGNSGPAKPKTLVSAADAQNGVVDGYVTVNRRRVPAQRFQIDGQTRMNINDAADGSGDWLDAEGYLGKTQAYWLKRFRTPTASEARVAKARSRQSGQGMVVRGDGPEDLKNLFRM